jgi:hypothetical protein
MYLDNGEAIICDDNAHQFITDPEIDGERKARGLVPRNWDTHPAGCYKAAPYKKVDFPLIPKSEYEARIKDMESEGSRLSDIRMKGMYGQMIPSRDQNGRGYCWFHSGTGALIYVRARDHQPYADLSAYSGACVIKNFRDEGGWGAQGVDFLTEKGCCISEDWPQRGTDRKYDTKQAWERALKYRLAEGWYDLESAQYDRNLTYDQVITLVLSRICVVVDFNWWSHSVLAIDATTAANAFKSAREESGKRMAKRKFDKVWDVDNPVTGGINLRIQNSWGDSWSDRGMGVLTGNKAVPDGAVAPRTATAAS